MKASLRNARNSYSCTNESYRANFGPLNNISTAKLFEDDPEYPLLTALENIDPETSKISLADIFTKRTIRPYERCGSFPAIRKPPCSGSGRVRSFGYGPHVSSPRQTEPEVMASLSPQTDLQGAELTAIPDSRRVPIRQRAPEAEGRSRGHGSRPAFERNVKELEAVQPEIVPFIDIDVRLGQTWVPTEVYAAFLNRHLAEQRPVSGDRAPSITRDLNGRWSVDLPSCYNTFELTHKWAGGGMSGTSSSNTA